MEGDLQAAERDELRDRLASASLRARRAGAAPAGGRPCSATWRPVSCTSRRTRSTASVAFVAGGGSGADRLVGGRGLRMAIVAALLVTGIGQVLALWGIGSEVSLDLDAADRPR